MNTLRQIVKEYVETESNVERFVGYVNGEEVYILENILYTEDDVLTRDKSYRIDYTK